MAETDGLAIARRRIAEEAQARTASLDLGWLDLRELPEELFALKRLRRLNLGSEMRDESWEWIRSGEATASLSCSATNI